MNWQPITDYNVKIVWYCPECVITTEIPCDYYKSTSSKEGLYCKNCDGDMLYLRTEINMNDPVIVKQTQEALAQERRWANFKPGDMK